MYTVIKEVVMQTSETTLPRGGRKGMDLSVKAKGRRTAHNHRTLAEKAVSHGDMR